MHAYIIKLKRSRLQENVCGVIILEGNVSIKAERLDIRI